MTHGGGFVRHWRGGDVTRDTHKGRYVVTWRSYRFGVDPSDRGWSRLRPRQRLALVTDAWHPQTNGVVNTLSRLVEYLEATGVEVLVISPDGYATIPFPSYPEVRVVYEPWRAIARLEAFRPDFVHLATEGPLGLWVRGYLGRRNAAFTTSFHTRFPEYLAARLPVPLDWGYKVERWFHNRAEHTLVGTETLILELKDKRVGRKLIHWPRGVDTELFRPERRSGGVYAGPRPFWLYVGRVAVEKNLEAFLSLNLPGTKIVVGDGPAREKLERQYPQTVWRGYRFGEDLARHYASADCFVFPSQTETFGNVILEALASGLPVAALPSPGPSDLIDNDLTGSVQSDLHAACLSAAACSASSSRSTALRYRWEASHERFRAHLVPVTRQEDPLAFLNATVTRRAS